MTVYTYEAVTARRTRKGKCTVCGKTTTRSRTFQNTISPFNRTDNGTVRTYPQVRERVEVLADAWAPDFDHWTCTEKAP